jgi:peptidoglycan/xylan/chitin deacetylase (PgdA/CDA1 family)
MHKIPILMYHGIHNNNSDAGEFDANYSVSEAVFRQHLESLRDHDYEATLLDGINTENSHRKKVVITFDDGDKSNIEKALPILVEYCMKAEFFITTGRIGFDKNVLDRGDILQLSQSGMSVQSHGVTHKYLTGLNPEELQYELLESKLYLEKITHNKVQYLSLPGGRGDGNVTNAARQLGYKAICTSAFGSNKNNPDLYSLKRISIYRHTTVSELSKMLDSNSIYYNYLFVRKAALDFAKCVIGNKNYTYIHQFISKYRK